MVDKKIKKNNKNVKQGQDIIQDPVFAEQLLERLNKTGMIVVDSEGVCIYISDVARQILSVTKRATLGKSFFDSVPLNTIEDQPIHERKHPLFQALGKKAYTQITPFFCKPAFGEEAMTLAMNILQIRKGRSVLGVVVQIRKAERELNIGEMKSLFVSFAAHQLKTPSSIVKGFLELMMREGRKSYSADQWNFLISAFESNEHLIHVSKTLLSLARLEGGLIAPQVRSFDPRIVLQSKIKSLEALLTIKKIQTSFTVTGKGHLHTDEGFFLEIFEIIFANAVKHSSNDTTIAVTCTATSQGTEVHVIDNGPGISQSMIEKLFVAAQSENTENNTHGLGLYMAKKYIALLGGKIGVKNINPGRGSDFYFSIPNQVA